MSSLAMPATPATWHASLPTRQWRRRCSALAVALAVHLGLGALLLTQWQVSQPEVPQISTVQLQLLTLAAPAPVQPPAPPVLAEPAPAPVVEPPRLEQAALARKRAEQAQREQLQQRLREEQQRDEQRQRREAEARAQQEQQRQAEQRLAEQREQAAGRSRACTPG